MNILNPKDILFITVVAYFSIWGINAVLRSINMADLTVWLSDTQNLLKGIDTMAATQQQQYTAANNLADTRTLLRTGIHYEQLVTQAGPFQPGQSCTTIKLNNAGILTGLRIVVQADCTVTSPVTASPYAPYNLLSNITLRDFAGISRINLPGHQLYSILCARYG
jgi:hypothetical protein